jgi:hypothetical protein
MQAGMTVFQRVMLANGAVGVAALVAVVASGRALSREELALLAIGGAALLAIVGLLALLGTNVARTRRNRPRLQHAFEQTSRPRHAAQRW